MQPDTEAQTKRELAIVRLLSTNLFRNAPQMVTEDDIQREMGNPLYRTTTQSTAAGHNYEIPNCPYRECLAREMYLALQEMLDTLECNYWNSEELACEIAVAMLAKAKAEMPCLKP